MGRHIGSLDITTRLFQVPSIGTVKKPSVSSAYLRASYQSRTGLSEESAPLPISRSYRTRVGSRYSADRSLGCCAQMERHRFGRQARVEYRRLQSDPGGSAWLRPSAGLSFSVQVSHRELALLSIMLIYMCSLGGTQL